MSANDEPVYEDSLGHYQLARRVGHRILKCEPPYVIGVCGSWGAGKTSFLKMLWAYLNGPFESRGHQYGCLNEADREEWFKESHRAYNDLVNGKKLELIWFNPWQHQFESSPLVALLQEIRQHFSVKRKLFDEAGKLGDVTTHALLNALAEVGKTLKIPIPSAKNIMERGREYESEHFSAALTSQSFRAFFEAAIQSVTGEHGLLVIFIDDLDRCEGDVAYRLLESLKLYINARNCVYVIGLDQQHLESSIARSLSGEKETWRYRPLARDYLSKIFQNLFLLPVPRHTSKYVEKLLGLGGPAFRRQLNDLFGCTNADWPKLVAAIDENLPHNPRKIKSFISSWKLYLDSLPAPIPPHKLDWRLTLILHYLAQFEEPLFRKVEEAPAFYSDHIVDFCRTGSSKDQLFEGLNRPYIMPEIDSDYKGGLGGLTRLPYSSEDGETKNDSSKLPPYPRVFWISRLILQHAKETSFRIDDEVIYRHLLQSGGEWIQPVVE